MTTASMPDTESSPPGSRRLRGCRVVTTSLSARVLLRGQLEALEEIAWSLVSGDDYPNAPSSLDFHVVPMRREPAPSDLASFISMYRFFCHNRYDFVQTHTPKASMLALPAVRLTGARVLYTVHGSLFFRGNHPLWNALGWLFERWCCSWASLVLVQSAEDRDVMPKARICRAGKVRFIGNGIRLSRFTACPPPEPFRASPVVVMISRLVAEKGCRDFFRAAEELGSVARFVHVGPFEHDQADAITAEECTAVARDTGIEFVGDVPDVLPYLAAADVVMLPSYREGIPRAAMEAAATGRPVVGYDIRGMREVIPEATGLLVPLGDVGRLVEKTYELIVSADERRARGKQCEQWVVQRFSEDAVVERLRDVYREVIGA